MTSLSDLARSTSEPDRCRRSPFEWRCLSAFLPCILHRTMANQSSKNGTTLFHLACLASLCFSLATTDTSDILLNCGSSSEETDSDGRKWTSDVDSKFTPSYSLQNSETAQTPFQDPSLPSRVPYTSARIFTSQFTYTFPVNGNQMFIRLYFYPFDFKKNLKEASDAFFSVNCGPYTLLRNFNTSSTLQALDYSYLIYEFYVPSTSLRFFNLSFTPSHTHPNAYAFVNGIEIVSLPDLFNKSIRIVGAKQVLDVPTNAALQTLIRLNVGGARISPVQDSGLFRTWEDDILHIYGAGFGVSYSANPNITVNFPGNQPEYIAPFDVYSTARSMGPDSNVNIQYNLTWILPVDPGFVYLVRFHFCEIQDPVINLRNQRVFKIFINNQTAEDEFDVIAWAGSNGEPFYTDYAVFVKASDLWVALTPTVDGKPQYYDAILNGLEVFKVNGSYGNLAGPNPVSSTIDPGENHSPLLFSTHSSSNRIPVIAGAMGALVFISLISSVLFSVVCRKSLNYPGENLVGNTISHALSVSPFRRFCFSEIKAATNNFDDSLVLGVGGFGKVYQGFIDGGTLVAIKRRNPLSDQGSQEFEAEIEMLSKLRHVHLVSLIGCCEEEGEMVLIYDYMARGTLREHLYGTQKPHLAWVQRLEICIGAALGLHYLHTGAKHRVIHRDVKTANILLDEKWVAKVSDFGLSKTGPDVDNSHVSTVVRGTLGYLDPEYYRRLRLTEKSDVFAFGVVLFEVLCGRAPVDPSLTLEEESLVEWALNCKEHGCLGEVIDPSLKGEISAECFDKFVEIAEKCVSDLGIDRPTMGDVVWNLELALQLQLQKRAIGDGQAHAHAQTDDDRALLDDSKRAWGNDEFGKKIKGIGGRSLPSSLSRGVTLLPLSRSLRITRGVDF